LAQIRKQGGVGGKRPVEVSEKIWGLRIMGQTANHSSKIKVEGSLESWEESNLTNNNGGRPLQRANRKRTNRGMKPCIVKKEATIRGGARRQMPQRPLKVHGLGMRVTIYET